MMDYPEGMPCWAPGAADYLASMLTGKENAVEWGSGASSVWLAPKVYFLHTIEHDIDWVERIAAETDRFDNVMIHHLSYLDPEYVEIATDIGNHRHIVWLIDGYVRIDCLEMVLECEQEGDIIVCDDALDYAEHLLERYDIKRFAMPHPHAGIPITSPKHKVWRNTVRTHHAMTKETWIWRV